MERSGQGFGMLRACRPVSRAFSARYVSRIGFQIREKTSELETLGLLHWRALFFKIWRSGHTRFGMRLSSKLFLPSSLVILLFAGVRALSLGAVRPLVSVNRQLT